MVCTLKQFGNLTTDFIYKHLLRIPALSFKLDRLA